MSGATQLMQDAEAIAGALPLPTITYPSVYVQWAKVMGAVQSVGKTGHNSAQNYSFRGIDAVVNAVGPALREHGVTVVPIADEAHYRDVEVGQKRTLMREVTVKVRYRVYGPGGDWFEGCSWGESMDSGDKGTPKAFSVAYRTFLLQALTIPTDEPDSDGATYERAAPVPAFVWDAKATKAELKNTLKGNAEDAKAAWEWASGDSLTEWSAESAHDIAKRWLERPMNEEGT